MSYEIALPKIDEMEGFYIYKPRDYMYALQTRQGYPCSIWVLVGEEKALVVDSGETVFNLKGAIEKVTDKPYMVVLTHGHPDHTAGVNEFSEIYMHEGDKGLIPNYKGTINFLKPGDRIDLGGIDIEVIDMIAHTPGSIGFLDHTHKIVFTGDAVGSSRCWMHLTPLPLEMLIGVITSLENRHGEWEEIWPAHFHESNKILGLEYLKDLKTILQKVVNGEEVATTEDKHAQEKYGLPFTPLVADYGTSGLVFNPAKIH